MPILPQPVGVINPRPGGGLSPTAAGASDAPSTKSEIHAGIVSTSGTALPHQYAEPQTQDRVSAIVRRFSLQGAVRGLLPGFRVSNCLRVPVASSVELWHHTEHQCASYGGLQTCGSVHVCPVCAVKISERRRDEVLAAVAAWGDRGGQVVMATFTLQHTADDSLALVGRALNEAYRKLRNGNRWKLFSDRYGLVGSITSREYTYGANGWHPHLHALLLVKPVAGPLDRGDAIEFETWLKNRWVASVASVGGFALASVGVTCRVAREGGELADYVVKSGRAWTVADELVKSNAKKGRQGRTPVQLLTDANLGDVAAGWLFEEYANWTYRHNALVWSPGLRGRLGLVVEKSDDEVAAEQLAAGRLLAVLDRSTWRAIVAHDIRAEVLLAAASGGLDLVVELLRCYRIEVDRSVLEIRLGAT